MKECSGQLIQSQKSGLGRVGVRRGEVGIRFQGAGANIAQRKASARFLAIGSVECMAYN